MALTTTELNQLYLAYFGRPGDVDGLNYYKNWTLADVQTAFSNSPESQSMYGTTFGAAQVNAIYQNLFNRSAEPDGIDYWINAVNNGVNGVKISPAAAAFSILVGAQNADKTAVTNKLAAVTSFLAGLDTTAEILAYSGAAANTVAKNWLATVTSDAATLTAAQASVGTTINTIAMLTTGSNNFTGTSFDASGVKGAVTANLTGAAAGTLATVKGGEGDDVVTVDLADLTANATISGGAGANTLKVSGAGTIQPTLSQFQTVELNGITGDSTISAKNVSDLATLAIKGTTGIGTSTVQVVSLPTSALTVAVEGEHTNNGKVVLTSPTVLTYTTKASATTTTTKAQDTVAVKVYAAEATNATINVGAYTKQSGDITVNKATAVTLNVASGKTADATPVEKTEFNAVLTANTAQNVTVVADGLLGSLTNIKAGAATLVNVTANGVVASGSTNTLKVEADKAQQVNITAGAALNIKGSTLKAAEQVTIAANAGKTDASNVDLAKISTLNLSGAGTATGNQSQVVLQNLGSATDITNAITVTATGLKGGAQVGNLDTKGGNVTLTATEMTGHFKAGAIGNGANKVGNVTVNAASLGSTEVGAISTVAGATVQINATNLLGKEATSKESLRVGAVQVATESSKNTGTISVTVDGSNAFDLATLQAKTVTVDASNFLGTVVDSTGGEGKGKVGTITGQNVTVKGGSLAANTFTIDAQKDVAETSATINVTGGLGNDKLIISNTSAFVNTEAYTISFNGGDGAADEIVFDTTVTDLTNVGSKLTLTNVEKLTATKSVTVKAADVTGLTLTVAAGTNETFTVKGTDAADTIDLSKITGALTVQGGKGADTIKLKADNATVDKVLFEATATDNGTDTITGFKAGAASAGGDVFDFNLLSGSGGTFTIASGGYAKALAARASGASGAVDISGEVVFISNQGAAQDTIAEVQALVTDTGSGDGTYKLEEEKKAVVFYGNVADGAQTFDIYHVTGAAGADTWVKIGVVGVDDGDGLIKANFVG